MIFSFVCGFMKLGQMELRRASSSLVSYVNFAEKVQFREPETSNYLGYLSQARLNA
jgi:hypothetical protein